MKFEVSTTVSIAFSSRITGTGSEGIALLSFFTGGPAGCATALGGFASATEGTGFGLASCGKILGMSAPQTHRKAIEINTATNSRFSMLWDRVPTSWVQWMTAQETAEGHPTSAHETILL